MNNTEKVMDYLKNYDINIAPEVFKVIRYIEDRKPFYYRPFAELVPLRNKVLGIANDLELRVEIVEEIVGILIASNILTEYESVNYTLVRGKPEKISIIGLSDIAKAISE